MVGCGCRWNRRTSRSSPSGTKSRYLVLAPSKRPTPLGPPWEPGHGPTVGSYGVAVSYRRGSPEGAPPSLPLPSEKGEALRVLKSFARNFSSQDQNMALTGLYVPGRLPGMEIQPPMAQSRSTKIIAMVKWIRTSRLSIKHFFLLLKRLR